MHILQIMGQHSNIFLWKSQRNNFAKIILNPPPPLKITFSQQKTPIHLAGDRGVLFVSTAYGDIHSMGGAEQPP
jgi:hypothetical protein